jgi:PAS domain S-box-containing protein
MKSKYGGIYNMSCQVAKKFKLGTFINLDKDKKFTVYLALVTLCILILLRFVSIYLFHTVVEVYSSIISMGIFIVAFNTYKITKNDFFMLLGIGYLFVGILDLCHTFSYADMHIFPVGLSEMPSRFWLVSRTLELCTIALSVFLLNNNIKVDYRLIFFSYLVLFTLFVLDILYFNIIPVCRIEGIGQTQFKIISEYIITFGFIICIYKFYKYNNSMDKSMFLYIEASMILKVFYELFIISKTANTDIFFLISHILKASSFYLMYKGIIVNGLQRPFDVLIYNLDKKEKQRIYMEESIFHNAQCTDLVINHSGDGMIIHGINSKIVYANSTALKLFGTSDVSDIIGKTILENIGKEYVEKANQNFRMIIENKTSTPFKEVKMILKNGNYIDVETSSSYIIYRGKPAILTILRGISSQERILSLTQNIKDSEKKLEESNEYNRVLSEFFTNISHELKTPINIILGSIQLMMQKNNNENILNIMRQNTYRLIRLVNNLIDISKFDSGFLNLNKRNHNIVSIVEEITFSVNQYFKSKGVDIIFDTDTEEKIMAIDDDKIERIILNLLSNAMKFTDAGGEIYVNVYDKDESIVISVKDTGIGIPEDKLKLIFDRFGQVDKSLTRNREGSGIGLSLVRSLVEMHGGNIKVNSKVGEGSEFIIELPITLMEDQNIENPQLYESKVDKIQIEFSDIYS